MSLKRSLRLLSSSERQLLKSQWLRSGQCARCFHACIQQRAESASEGAPFNPPQRGPTRVERSTKISNELSMLQKGASTGSASPPASSSSTGFLETPNEMGGTRMGENVSAGREGPNAQGVGRPIQGDAVQDTTNLATTSDAAKEPAESTSSPEQTNQSSRNEESDPTWNDNQASALTTKLLSTKPLGVPFPPIMSYPSTLRRLSKGASTLASKNYIGLIHDRAALLTTPVSPRDSKPTKHRISADAQAALVDKFVRGNYDPKGYLAGDKFKHKTLSDVARQGLRNGTFLQGDVERVVRKVQSLLPAATATRVQPQPKN